jgi:anti-anti-sigma factor
MVHAVDDVQADESGIAVSFDEVRTLSGCYLLIAGELDVATASAVHAALSRLETTPDPCGVCLNDVAFADSNGLEPIVEAIRRAVAQRRTPLRICTASPAVRRIFDCLGVRWQPIFDLAAWDAAKHPPVATSEMADGALATITKDSVGHH